MKQLLSHSVSRNAFALGAMQAANYLVPLLLLPFLTRVLGLEGFGIIAITLSTLQLIALVTDYGFSLSATYEIAKNRTETSWVNQYVSAIFSVKLLILALVAFATIILTLQPAFAAYTDLIVYAFIAACAQAFQPIWLFQGLEKMKNVTIYTVSAKFLYAGLVLLLVRDTDDTSLVIMLWAIAQIVATIIAFIAMKNVGVSLVRTSFALIGKTARDSAGFFYSRIAVSTYTAASTMIVGWAGSAAQAGAYGLCEQIYKAGQNLTTPVSQALYPYMANSKDWPFFFKCVSAIIVFLIATCALISWQAETLLGFFFGDEFRSLAQLLDTFLVIVVINFVGVIFGYPALGALNLIRKANLSVVMGAIIHLVQLTVLYFTQSISAQSVAFCVLITETAVAVVRSHAVYHGLQTKRHASE